MEPGDFIQRKPLGQAGVDEANKAISSSKSTDEIPRILSELKQQMALSRQASTKTERENATFLADKFNSILDSNLRSSLSQWATMSPNDPRRDTFYTNILKAVSERTDALRSGEKLSADDATGKISSFFDEYKKVKAKPSTMLTGEAMPEAAEAFILVEGLKQVYSFFRGFTMDTITSFQSIVKVGGDIRGSFASAAQVASLLTNGIVDVSEAAKAYSAFLKEYGVSLADAMVKQNGVMVFDKETRDKQLRAAASAMPELIMQASFFGLSADQVSQSMGKLIARFHTGPDSLMSTFQTLGDMSLTTGVDLGIFSDFLTTAGDRLRYTGADAASYAHVVDSVYTLTTGMQKLSEAGGKWTNIKPGEYAEVLNSLSSAWKSMTPASYIGLTTTGPGAPGLGGIADKFTEFWKEDPLKGMQKVAEKYMSFLPDRNMTPEQKYAIVGGMSPQFQQFGSLAPLMVQALTSIKFSDQEYKKTAGDPEKFIALATKKMGFTFSGSDLEKMYTVNELLRDPLKTLVNYVGAIARHLITGNVTPGEQKMIKGIELLQAGVRGDALGMLLVTIQKGKPKK